MNHVRIPNHAFYLSAVALGGFTWVVLGRIWYRVLTAKLSPTAQFTDFALATVAMAGELYGAGGQVQTTIADAWSAVGLPVPPRASKRTVVRPIRPAERPVRRLRGEWRERKAA